jgi:protein SCO1/2
MSRLPWLIVLVATAAAVAGFLLSRQQRAEPPSYPSLTLYGEPRGVPDFALERADGTGTFTQANLKGRLNLVFFGFTHCPDICPTTLAAMREIESRLEGDPARERLQFVFVSVDPERDDAKTLAQYAGAFSPSIIALRGEDAALEPLTRSLGVVYQRRIDESGQPMVDHSVPISLIDPEARMIGVIRPPHSGAQIAADLKRLVSP